MANIKISDLTAASAAAGANEFEINESGTSKKVTGTQISAFVKADLLDDTTVNFTGTLQNGGSNVVVDSDIGSSVQAYDANTAKYSNLGVRNLIINGDMRIAQRSTSLASITADGYYTVDRFQTTLSSLGTWTQSQSTDVPTGEGFATSLKLDCTTANASPAAGDRLVIKQRFEGQNLQYLKKGTASAVSLTASFWVKSTKTGTFILELFDVNNTRQISKSYTVDVTNTWEKKTITFEGDTTGAFTNNNGASLDLSFWLGAGTTYTSGTLNTTWGSSTNANRAVGQVNIADSTSNDWYMTGVQLEVGTEATPFEHRPYDMELATCQRYYQKSWSQGTAAGSALSISSSDCTHQAWASSNTASIAGQSFLLPVVMRAIPTFVIYDVALNLGKVTTLDAGASGTDNVSFNQAVVSDSGFRVRIYANSAYGMVFAYTLTAEL